MGCHRIGLGMNSVVKEAIEMFENEEIGLNACKKIIMACKNGVYWCDDLGSIMLEENVVRAAGTAYQMSIDKMVNTIEKADFKAAQRDTEYNIIRRF